MAQRIRPAGPPTGLLKLAFRVPVWLYRAGMGGLLGRRMLLLNHVGRTSGLRRQNVLEIAAHHPSDGSYDVASGFGRRSQWYRNVGQLPEVTIQVGRRTIPVTAVLLSPEESSKAMVDYAQRHPRAARELMKVCGYAVDGTVEDYAAVGRDYIPFVRFRPTA